jgi:hypothetical protein
LIDARVLSARWAAFTRDAQAAVPCKLGGGVALAAALRHRRSRDLDLFLPSADAVSILRRALPEIAARAGVTAQIVQEAPGFVRARLVHPEEGELGLDLVHDAAPELAPDPVVIDGIALVSDRDLRASKLTCLLSRSEPRDLVDVLFLERAGFLPEDGLLDAARKDGGMDAGTLSWLLMEFPTRPLPEMLVPLTGEELLVPSARGPAGAAVVPCGRILTVPP